MKKRFDSTDIAIIFLSLMFTLYVFIMVIIIINSK